MIKLNQQYSTKALAIALELSYDHFRKYRQEYEDHLGKFYNYTKTSKGSSVLYLFEQELYPYVPYKEYKKAQKSNTLRKHIRDTIHYDNRQTGSNITRIIFVDNEIQTLGWAFSTLEVYVREELKQMVEAGYYIKEDYRWCYLNKERNCYELLEDEDVKRLRSFFQTRDDVEQEENIWSNLEQGHISQQEASEAVSKLRKDAFMSGRQHFQMETGKWPIKVPVYKISAFAPVDFI